MTTSTCICTCFMSIKSAFITYLVMYGGFQPVTKCKNIKAEANKMVSRPSGLYFWPFLALALVVLVIMTNKGTNSWCESNMGFPSFEGLVKH